MGFTERLKALFTVLAIAKWLVGGLAAAAERNDGAPGKSVRVSGRILDTEIALKANRTVIKNGYFGRHSRPMVPEGGEPSLYNYHRGYYL